MIYERGFTLIEILVAIVIFAIFSLLAYGTINQVIESRDRLTEERAFWRDLSIAFLHLEDDLKQAQLRPIRDITGETLRPFSGDADGYIGPDARLLEFTRGGLLTFQNDHKQSDLIRVAYQLQDEQLLRLTWPVLDRAPSTEPRMTPLLNNILSINLAFYSDDANTHAEWPPGNTSATDAPNNNTQQTLPKGLVFDINIRGRGEFTRTFIVKP